MADRNELSPCSSPDSIPASADGSEATTPQVKRALELYNHSKPHTAASGSRDTPPPPEHKSHTMASNNSSERRRRYQFYVPDGTNTVSSAKSSPVKSTKIMSASSKVEKRGADPPEITTPIHTQPTQGEEAAHKVRSRLIRLQNRNQGNFRRSTGDDFVEENGEKERLLEDSWSSRRSQSEVLGESGSVASYEVDYESYGVASKNGSVTPSRKSPKTQEKILTDLFDGHEEEDDDDDDLRVNMAPIESDDEEERTKKNYGSAPSSPQPNQEYNPFPCPSSAPLDSTRSSGQSMKSLFIGNKKGFQPPLWGDAEQSVLETPFPARKKQQQGHPVDNQMNTDVETLDDSITYLRNLQVGQDPPPSQQQLRPHRPPPPIIQDQHHLTTNTRDHRPSPRKPDKKGKYLTAQEAINYVMSSTARTTDSSSLHQASDDINKTYSFLNNMTNMEILEYGLTGIGGTSKDDDGEPNAFLEEDDDDDDDFERNTSLSMHAEEKYSKHAEDKSETHASSSHRRVYSGVSDEGGSSISISEREGGVDMIGHRMKEFPSGRKTVDHHVSDSHLYHSGGKLGKTVSGATNNPNLYASDTIIDISGHSGFDQGYVHPQQGRRKSAHPAHTEFGGAAALGPRNKKPGGVTGVNLGDYTKNQQPYRDENAGYRSENSFSEHSMRSDEGRKSITNNDDGYVTPPMEYDNRVDVQSTDLMTMLCGHLLPLGIDDSMQHDDTFCGVKSMFVQSSQKLKPSWNNDDPDEPGYVVHRLTNAELNSVEYSFEKLMAAAAANNNFERDLEQAEMVLDEEEKRYNAEMKRVPQSPGSEVDSHVGSTKEINTTISYDEDEERECVPDFPGIFAPGKGRPGELECFYLPIITKSQKTGFEPTKDLVLKPGTVFANNYLVQGELGSAAFSTAYRCVDLSSEEDEDGYQDEVCLKVIKNTKDYFDQSIDEIKILRLLKDTGKIQENNIVEMRSFFYHREHLVIVTELLRQNMYEFGKSIIESRGPAYFTRDRLSHITRQCLIALKFVHELGLMHCDIKPEVRQQLILIDTSLLSFLTSACSLSFFIFQLEYFAQIIL